MSDTMMAPEAAAPPVADPMAGLAEALMGAAGAPPTMMVREVPDPSESRKALCKRMAAEIEGNKAYWKPAFDDMGRWSRIARNGGDPAWKEAGLYVANICQEHVNAKTAKLYAKNPTVRVDRRPSLDFEIWDGTLETLQAAAMDPINGALVIQDAQRGGARRKMLDGVAKTLQLVSKHQMDKARPPFKRSMKQTVVRVVVNGVGYVKLGYERHMHPAPETVTQTANLEARLANIERLQADLHDPEAPQDGDSADAEALRLALGELKNAPMAVQDEGLRFDFPASQAIIPDRLCTDLHGFAGCDVVAEEFEWTVAQIQEMFGVDVRGAGDDNGRENGAQTAYTTTGAVDPALRARTVWMAYNRKDGLVYWVCKGYPDFLSEPAPPPILLTRFWPWFALTFNEVDSLPGVPSIGPFPPSDIELIRYMQDEHNRARQGLRDHRIAARPKTAGPRGMLSDEDKKNLTEADAHVHIELDNLQPNQKLEDVLQIVKHPGIDPNMYDTSQVQQDQGRVTGMQSADRGMTSGVTATEVSRAANSADIGAESNIDDMNGLLSELMNEAGRVLLMEMEPETAKRIAGPGAVWPTIPTADVFDGVLLDIQAGSSGRPNKQIEVQTFERMAPILLQIPGIGPNWLAKEAIRRLDENIDPADAVVAGLPSILAMATMAAKQAQGAPPGPQGPGAGQGAVGGGPQGDGGGNNAPRPDGAVSQPAANPAPESAVTVAGRGGMA